jgi:hypothetical protein
LPLRSTSPMESLLERDMFGMSYDTATKAR